MRSVPARRDGVRNDVTDSASSESVLAASSTPSLAGSAAFFDVDGTLAGCHIVHHFLFIRRRMLPAWLQRPWTAAFYLKAPYYLILDKISRTRLNVVFYRNYSGLSSEAVKGHVEDNFEQVIRPHLFAAGADCVAEHRRAGRRIVLVTGSIDFIMAPLARFLGADEVLAPKLVERNGRFTGALDGPPVGSEEKARRIRAYAETHRLDLTSSYAYGDSIADLPMLEQVGHPHAINPDKALEQTARDRGWPALRWSSSSAHDSAAPSSAPMPHSR